MKERLRLVSQCPSQSWLHSCYSFLYVTVFSTLCLPISLFMVSRWRINLTFILPSAHIWLGTLSAKTVSIPLSTIISLFPFPARVFPITTVSKVIGLIVIPTLLFVILLSLIMTPSVGKEDSRKSWIPIPVHWSIVFPWMTIRLPPWTPIPLKPEEMTVLSRIWLSPFAKLSPLGSRKIPNVSASTIVLPLMIFLLPPLTTTPSRGFVMKLLMIVLSLLDSIKIPCWTVLKRDQYLFVTYTNTFWMMWEQTMTYQDR